MGVGAPAIYRPASTRSVDPTPSENISDSRWLAAGPRGLAAQVPRVIGTGSRGHGALG
jgi:hypothetical protein